MMMVLCGKLVNFIWFRVKVLFYVFSSFCSVILSIFMLVNDFYNFVVYNLKGCKILLLFRFMLD